MTKTKVRVRFAPSPTGLMHLGGIRSALFNYLYAHKTGGAFILRFEDTDRDRLVPEAVLQIEASLNWLGLNPDEGAAAGGEYGPYVQSERLSIYKEQAEVLTRKGDLYPCWCTPERLDDLRQAAQENHTSFKYDRHCLEHPGDPKHPHVLRFKVPAGVKVKWDDGVKGATEFMSDDLDDFVAVKSDGFPTYHFASVVDDHLMQISHVLRADEWLPSTPKHLLLYQAFEWQPPVFAHLPQVLGTDKTKLSKRHGAKPVLDYRHDGYLPAAVVNFLALLGWNEGEGSTKEIYSLSELIKAFSLERIQKSPAVFDQERLNWLNGEYLRQMSTGELYQAAKTFLPSAARSFDRRYVESALALVQERVKFFKELPELTDFFFSEPMFDPKQLTKLDRAEVKRYLEATIDAIKTAPFDHYSLEQLLRALATKLGAKPGDLFMSIRVAITGKTATPPLFETMAVLGQKTVIVRLSKAAQAF